MGQEAIKNTVIDSEIGEILRERTYFRYDGFNEKGYRYRYRGDYIRYYWDAIPHNLSKDSLFLLLMLAELANNENVLIKKVKRKSKFSNIISKPMDKTDVMEKLRYPMGINKFDKCWQELKKHCIKKVRYHDYLVWAINPAYISRCKEIPTWLYEEFDMYLNPYMTKLAIAKFRRLVRISKENL